MNASVPFSSGAEPEAASADLAEQVGVQVGALCWRKHGRGVQVLLITSRETGRWVIPKGGTIAGHDAGHSALIEAWEEAGVEGHLSAQTAMGCFDYDKLDRKRDLSRRCRVAVYPVKVDRLQAKFPEKGQRQRKWFKVDRAAARVDEAELRSLLQALANNVGPLTAA